jgi:hypothetical protein
MISQADEQGRVWKILYDRIAGLMQQYGTEDHFGKGDYLIDLDNYGWHLHRIEVHRLHMMQPNIVKELQRLLADFTGWEIVIAVDVPGTEGHWPPMGIVIQENAVIDKLQRPYLPKEFQEIRY